MVGSRNQGLFGATLAFFVGLAAVALFGPTAKSLNAVLGLDGPTLGLLIGVPSLTGALLRIPFGAWVEKTGGKIPNIVLLSVSVLGLVGLALTMEQPALWSLVLFGALAGFGIATFSVSAAQVSYWFPKKDQGKALGIYGGVANMSPGIASFLIPLALGGLGVVATYWVWTGFIVVGLLVYLVIGVNAPYFQFIHKGEPAPVAQTRAKELGQELFPSGTVLQSLVKSASYWQTWILVAIYFASFGGFLALTAWLPNYWQTFYGMNLFPLAVSLTAAYSVGTSLARTFGGFITDALGGERSAFLALSLMLVGSILVALSGGMLAMVVAGLILMLLGMGLNNAATFKIIPAVVPGSIGGASGWVGGIGALGGFVFPVVQGYFLKNPNVADPGYNQSFWVYAGAAGLSLVLLAVLMKSQSKGKKEA